MKKTLLAAFAALTTAAFVAPAIAQPYGPPPPPYGRPGGWDIAGRIHWIQDRILRGRDDGSLDRREFDRVQRELNSIRHEDENFRRFHGGHLDEGVRINLEARLDHLNDQIHWMREHGDRRPW